MAAHTIMAAPTPPATTATKTKALNIHRFNKGGATERITKQEKMQQLAMQSSALYAEEEKKAAQFMKKRDDLTDMARLTSILQSSADLRSDADMRFLQRFFDLWDIFTVLKLKGDSAAQNAFSRAAVFASFAVEEPIYEQDLEGSEWFFIISGTIELSEAKPQTATRLSEPTITTLTKGQGFGEFGEQAHASSATARTAADVISVDFVAYEKWLVIYRQQELRAKVSFLRKMDTFIGVPHEQLFQLGLAAQIKHFHSNDVIIKEGDPAHEVFVLRKGSVRVLKRVAFQHQPKKVGAPNLTAGSRARPLTSATGHTCLPTAAANALLSSSFGGGGGVGRRSTAVSLSRSSSIANGNSSNDSRPPSILGGGGVGGGSISPSRNPSLKPGASRGSVTINDPNSPLSGGSTLTELGRGSSNRGSSNLTEMGHSFSKRGSSSITDLGRSSNRASSNLDALGLGLTHRDSQASLASIHEGGGGGLLRAGSRGSASSFVSMQDASRQMAKKAEPIYRVLEIATMWKGSLFGEIGVINKVPRTASVLASCAVEVFVIPKSAFLTYLNSSLLDDLRFRTTVYPTDDDLRDSWCTTQRWEANRRRVMQSMLSPQLLFQPQ